MLNSLRKQRQYPPHLTLDRDIEINVPWHAEENETHRRAPLAPRSRQPLTTLGALEIIRQRYEHANHPDQSAEAA